MGVDVEVLRDTEVVVGGVEPPGRAEHAVGAAVVALADLPVVGGVEVERFVEEVLVAEVPCPGYEGVQVVGVGAEAEAVLGGVFGEFPAELGVDLVDGLGIVGGCEHGGGIGAGQRFGVDGDGELVARGGGHQEIGAGLDKEAVDAVADAATLSVDGVVRVWTAKTLEVFLVEEHLAVLAIDGGAQQGLLVDGEQIDHVVAVGDVGVGQDVVVEERDGIDGQGVVVGEVVHYLGHFPDIAFGRFIDLTREEEVVLAGFVPVLVGDGQEAA